MANAKSTAKATATKSTAKAAPKAAPASKAAPKAAPVAPVAPAIEVKVGKIDQIIAFHEAGKTNAEIVDLGFNKTTVSIQVSKYKKDPKKYKASRK